MLQFHLVYHQLSLYVKQKLSHFPCVRRGILQGQSDMSKLWGENVKLLYILSHKISYWCKSWLEKIPMSLCRLDGSLSLLFSGVQSWSVLCDEQSKWRSVYAWKDTMTDLQHSSIHSLQHISLPTRVQPNTAFWLNYKPMWDMHLIYPY